MEPAPIQYGANRPEGRPWHALPSPALVRLLVLAGLAFVGWLALAAVNDVAHAAQPGAVHADDTRASAPTDLITRPLNNERAVGIVAAPVQTVTETVTEPGLAHQPVRPPHERRPDVLTDELADKDGVVNEVRSLTGSAGVPHVRVPLVASTPLVDDATGTISDAPHTDTVQPTDPSTADPATATAGAPGHPSSAARAHPATATAVGFPADPGPSTGGCPGCWGDQHGPLSPGGQDEPRNSSGGGHHLTPVADLMRGGRYPAVTAAVAPGMFDRTALTDVFAPGGPSVVPD